MWLDGVEVVAGCQEILDNRRRSERRFCAIDWGAEALADTWPSLSVVALIELFCRRGLKCRPFIRRGSTDNTITSFSGLLIRRHRTIESTDRSLQSATATSNRILSISPLCFKCSVANGFMLTGP